MDPNPTTTNDFVTKMHVRTVTEMFASQAYKIPTSVTIFLLFRSKMTANLEDEFYRRIRMLSFSFDLESCLLRLLHHKHTGPVKHEVHAGASTRERRRNHRRI